uniref:Uncharacterized protein n=1 Tax=Glossina pallidipes TaxID=7398 RepID=A0A1A9ZQ27_GLOPL
MLLLENSHQCIYNDSAENDSCSFHIFSYNRLRAEASKGKHDFQIITESTDVLLKEERMDIMYYNNSNNNSNSNNGLKATTSSLVSSLGIFQFTITFVILYSAFSDA